MARAHARACPTLRSARLTSDGELPSGIWWLRMGLAIRFHYRAISVALWGRVNHTSNQARNFSR